jgi:hypothetical protein
VRKIHMLDHVSRLDQDLALMQQNISEMGSQ